MISKQSLTENIIPNIYLKKIILNSDYKDAKNKKTREYTVFGSTISTIKPTQTLSDIGISNMLISMKFVKTQSIESEMLQLLNTELKEYINVYIHQITDKDVYEAYATDSSLAATEQSPFDSELISTKKINLTELMDFGADIPIGSKSLLFKNEQTLSDGTQILELVQSLSFNFDKDVDFLGYVMLVVLEPLGAEGIAENFTSKITSDIIILDGQFQNEGLIFTIAPYDPSDKELAKFGKPGDIWSGGVHLFEGQFMAGDVHSDKPHPFLNYDVVPVTKFVDNRVKAKIEKKIINLTKSYEKVSSLGTAYNNTFLNLLDFEEYKNVSYISDLYLAQDSKANVNGLVSVDKHMLLKNKGAMSFIFDNIQKAFKDDPEKREQLLNIVYDSARLERLNIYENNLLMGTITYNTPTDITVFNNSMTEFNSTKDAEFANFSITMENDIKLNDNSGLQHFSFKKINKGKSSVSGKFHYRLEVEYRDPTVEFVKSVLPSIASALEDIEKLLAIANKKEITSTGLKSGFNPYTQTLNENTINKIINKASGDIKITSDNVLSNVAKLVENDRFVSYVYNEDLNYKQIVSEIKKMARITVASLEEFLLLQDLLNNIKSQIEAHLASFGSKPTKDLGGTADQNSYATAKGVTPGEHFFSSRVLTEEAEAHIIINSYGYDFLGYMPIISNDDSVTAILNNDYKNTVLSMLKQITTSDQLSEVELNSDFQAKGFITSENLTKDGFSFLNIPIEIPNNNSLKKSIVLPASAIDINDDKVQEDDIFNAIIKFKTMLSGDDSDHKSFDKHKTRIDKQLSEILAFNHNASIGPVFRASSETTKKNQEFDLFGDSSKRGFKSPSKNRGTVEKAPPNNFNYNFLKTALLSKGLMSNMEGFIPNMSKPTFKPFGDLGLFALAKSLPVQVKCLSIKNNNLGPFKDFLKTDQFYINTGIINPLYLCYFWFIHQNIVGVEYLDNYEVINDNVVLKNVDNPYEKGMIINTKTRNIKRPVWKKVDLKVLDSLAGNERLICRLVRFEDKNYINTDLLKSLEMPLINNFFVLEGQGIQTGPGVTFEGIGALETGPAFEI